ncbi:MAG TPA: hypothetical protein VFJ16_25095 [Longimicrobium sp.]|nr:hypothetical protein [Longimicrobium sp.]
MRDPDSGARGIIVLSAQALDDCALFLGTAALELDTRLIEPATEPRMVRVWEDGRVTSDADGDIGSVDLSLLPAERTTGLLEYLRARAVTDSIVEIPRIGRARLLKF